MDLIIRTQAKSSINDENNTKKKIEKKETNKNKEKIAHKSNNVCITCKNNIKMNEKNIFCKNCFKNNLIK